MEKINGKLRKILLIGGIVGFAGILFLFAWLFFFDKDEEDGWQNLPGTAESTIIATSNSSQQQTIFVDIKGAIQKPGVYELSSNARLQELVQVAGGLTADAEDRQVNLAVVLTDQQLIYIPHKGEMPEQAIQSAPTTTEANKVNINTASLAELQTLNGIGEKKAQAIIDYRTKNGTFQSVDQLTEVDGFGEKTVEKLRDSITI